MTQVTKRPNHVTEVNKKFNRIQAIDVCGVCAKIAQEIIKSWFILG
jgi:hypothetical protein